MPHNHIHPSVHPATAMLAPRQRRSRGQGLVEMALALPLLLLLMLGIIEMGRLFFAWVTVQHAARAGARMAITGQGEQEGTRLGLITAKAQEVADNLYGGGTVITVRSWNGVVATGAGQEGDPGDPCELVEVEVRYTYRPVITLIADLMPNDGQIVLQGRDRKLNEPWIPCP